MNIKGRINFISDFIVLVAVGCFGVSSVFARDVTNILCDRLAQVETKIDTRLDNAIVHLVDVKATTTKAVFAKRAQALQELTASRTQTDETLSKTMQALLAQATTDQDRSRIENAQAKIAQALNDRRTSIDTTIATAQTQVDQALADRAKAIAQAEENLKSAIHQSFNQTTTECTSVLSTVSPKDLRDQIQHAHQVFLQSAASTDFQSKLKAIAAQKQQAVAQIEARYQATIAEVLRSLTEQS